MIEEGGAKIVFEYLFERQAQNREYIMERIKNFPVEDLRKRVPPNKWSVEELIRHIMFTTEYWMKRVVFQDEETPFHPIGVENDTQATKWYSLDEVSQGMNQIYKIVSDYLSKNPDYSQIIPFNDEQDFEIKWILWHILQHELETWGQIAERIRTYGYPTPWEF